MRPCLKNKVSFLTIIWLEWMEGWQAVGHLLALEMGVGCMGGRSPREAAHFNRVSQQTKVS